MATPPPLSDRSGVTDAVRAQILATEHWSLLATRSMTWNEVFSRAAMYLTLVSATVVSLALVAQATNFGERFRLFALLVLPLVLIVGIATVLRLGDANSKDVQLVIGMNRLRHAYLELAPELERYFITESHDDVSSVMRTYGERRGIQPGRLLSGTPTVVAAITAVVAGVLAALIADSLGASGLVTLIAGVAGALLIIVWHGTLAIGTIARVERAHKPLFPR